MALSDAERQRRYRARRAADEPIRQFTPVPVAPQGRTRPKRWAAALDELRTLQGEYEEWRDQLPESLAESRTAELLDEVCELDVDALDVQLPRGFGRDRIDPRPTPEIGVPKGGKPPKTAIRPTP